MNSRLVRSIPFAVLVSTFAARPALAQATGPSVGPGAAAVHATGASSDHLSVVRRAGLRYFGAVGVGDAPGSNGTQPPADSRVQVHSLGLRVWVSPRVGLEVGAGLGGRFGEQTTMTGGTRMRTAATPVFGYGVRMGVPIALAWTRHLTLSVVPYVSLSHGMDLANATTPSSTHWIHLEAGATLAAELHFGFLGIPQLALEARLGLRGELDLRTNSYTDSNGSRSTEQSHSVSIGTTADAFAVDRLFTSTLALTYYF